MEKNFEPGVNLACEYKVKRDAIYVGKRIFNLSNAEGILYKIHHGRTQLFTIDEETNKSIDLLYECDGTQNVYGISYDIKKMWDEFTEPGAIYLAYSLSNLLKHFNYDDVLNYGDVVRIKNLFFNKNFLDNFRELFGEKHIQPEQFVYNAIQDKKNYEETLKKSLEYLEQQKKNDFDFDSIFRGKRTEIKDGVIERNMLEIWKDSYLVNVPLARELYYDLDSEIEYEYYYDRVDAFQPCSFENAKPLGFRKY